MPWAAEHTDRWNVVRLKDIAEVVNGYPFDAKLFDAAGIHPLVRIRDLNNTETETRFNGDWVAAAEIDTGDVLVGMDGDFNVAVWKGGKALLNQRMCCIRGASPLLSKFLSYLLPAPLKVINDLTYCTTVKHLSSKDVERITLSLPPVTDLSRVVSFLDEHTARIDALIAEKERLALRVKEYEQAEISKLLTEGLLGVDLEKTGNTFVPLAPPGWRVVAFKRAIRGMEQGWSPQCENRPAEDGEWGVLKVGCVNGTKFNPLENKALPPQLEPDISCVLQRRDVLVSRANTRELVGLAALVDDDLPNLLLCDKLYRLHLRNEWVLPEYAVLALRSNASRRQIEFGASGASSSMQNISQDVIRELVVALPPLGEQAAIVERSAVIRRNCNDLAVHVEAHITRLREYRSSLISAAVTGQLDIDSYAPECT